MPITYPLTFPSRPEFSDAFFFARTVTALTRSPYSGTTQVFRHPGAWWEADLTLPVMTESTFRPWRSLLLSLHGVYGTVLVADPSYTGTTGTGNYQGCVVNGNNQMGNELNVGGLGSHRTNAVAAGDRFQLGSGLTARLYEVLESVDSSGAGYATLKIFPRLRDMPVNTDSLTFGTSPMGLFRLADPEVPQWESGANRIVAPVTIRLIEAI